MKRNTPMVVLWVIGLSLPALCAAPALADGDERLKAVEDDIATQKLELEKVTEVAQEVADKKTAMEQEAEAAKQQLVTSRQAIGENEAAARKLEQKLELELGEKYELKRLRDELKQKDEAMKMAETSVLTPLRAGAEYQAAQRRLEELRNAPVGGAPKTDTAAQTGDPAPEQPVETVKSVKEKIAEMERKALEADVGYQNALAEYQTAKAAHDEASKKLREEIDANTEYQEYKKKAEEARSQLDTATQTQKDAQKALRELTPQVNSIKAELQRIETSISRLERRKEQLEKQVRAKNK